MNIGLLQDILYKRLQQNNFHITTGRIHKKVMTPINYVELINLIYVSSEEFIYDLKNSLK